MKKLTKKFTITLLTVSLGAAMLAGCGSGKEEAGADGKVKLELFANKPEAASTYKELIKQFEAKNPNIDVELTLPPEAETVLKTRLTKNDMPDLMAIGGNAAYGEIARAGAFYDFSNESYLENIQPAYIEMIGKLVGSEKKGVYGIPYAANANGILYNKEKLDQLGIQPPKTWDEFIAALEKAKVAGETPIYFTLKDSWTAMVTWNSLAAALQGDDFAEKRLKGETTFAETHGEVADKFLELLKYGHKDNFGKGYSDGNTAFAKGGSVFYLQGVWAIPEILKANPNMKLGVCAFPVTNDPAKNRLVSGVDVLLTMAKDTEHPKEAKKFIEFMLQQDIAKKYIDEQSAFSAIKGIYQENPIMEGIKVNFEQGTITSFPDHYYPAGMQAANLVQEFLIKKDKEKFLKKMDAEWDKVQNR
ncbi:extracellular solute-binding protein [Geobacillus thermodenitrificans]|jgi:raffinose/stachyose/melibiose transport system substrate-binding protein|uniref:ABC transporter substrate-binding protein n=1 Tax=Geobacillus thermodenitrificans TaxID=33940 RepID=UPI000C05AFB6|nr:extracellular solute-binding protein [Geobacillus thermodenitrificans]ATO37189.1 ABC transporter substrate-binding protein [Geobacillus thermodenitrificans]